MPVATEDGALATARGLDPYDPSRVTVLHVVEKGDGAPDKTPVEQSEALAEDAYAAVRTVFPDAADRTAYARNVVDAIFGAAEDVGSGVDARPADGAAAERGRSDASLAGPRVVRVSTNLENEACYFGT